MSMMESSSSEPTAVLWRARRAGEPYALLTWACLLLLGGCESSGRADGDTAAPAKTEATAVRGAAMQLEEHKALATKALVEIFNQRNYAATKAYAARDFRSHNPQVPPGPEGLEAFARQFGDAFADFRGDIRELLAEADKVVMWIRWQGRHTGTFAGIAATGNTVEFDTVEIFRIRDGQLIEHWDVADRWRCCGRWAC